MTIGEALASCAEALRARLTGTPFKFVLITAKQGDVGLSILTTADQDAAWAIVVEALVALEREALDKRCFVKSEARDCS